MRTVKPCSSLCLLQDGEGIPALLLVIVDWPARMHPVPELQQPPELIRLACNHFLKAILIAKALQARIVVVLYGSEDLGSIESRSLQGCSHDRLRSCLNLHRPHTGRRRLGGSLGLWNCRRGDATHPECNAEKKP